MNQTRFKEYRMLIICTLLLVGSLVLVVLSALYKDQMRLVFASVLSVSSLMLLGLRYYNIVDDTYMVNYRWQVAALLPEIIEYSDITDIKKISKHKVCIQHIHKSNVYVLNSDKLIEELNTRMKVENKND